jgi:hypothetical protein
VECVIRIKGRFSTTLTKNDSEEKAKDQFYEQLEQAYPACPNHDVKLVMRDANAKNGRETVHQPTRGKHSLHETANENGLRLVDFAAGKQMAIKITYFMHKRIHLQTWHSPDGHTLNQIDHCLIDRRHFSDVIDVLVVIKLRERICCASNTKPQQLRRFAVGRLNDMDVASLYYDELKSELQGGQAQPLSLDVKCKN